MIAVTKLIDILNKKALVYWSNKLGLKGVSLKEFYKESSNKGIDKHKQVENYLLKGIDFQNKDELDLCLKGCEIIGVEEKISNGFINGRVDLIVKKKDQIIIIDFKSNNKIYLQHKLQLSTYKEIYKADKIGVINFDTWNLELINIDTKKYYEIVKRLYQINELLIEVNESI